MSRLRWNFAERRWWNRPWIAVCVIAFSGCVHALWWRQHLLAQREDAIERVDTTARHVTARQYRMAAPPPALDQVFAQMRYPWLDVLDSLQRAAKPGLQLLTLEPDAGAIRRVNISGVASRVQDVFDFVVALQGDRSWASVRLVSQAKNEDTSALPAADATPPPLPVSAPAGVSFSLVAEWGRP